MNTSSTATKPRHPGRPRIGQRIVSYVPDETLAVIAAHADATGITLAAAIRSATIRGAREMEASVR